MAITPQRFQCDAKRLRVANYKQPYAQETAAIFVCWLASSDTRAACPSAYSDPAAWSSVFRERSLEQSLSEEDHVEAIRDYFLESLAELEKLLKAHPILLG